MVTENDIRGMLRSFFQTPGDGQAIVAKVKDVDPDNCTCTLDYDGAEMYDVRLKPVTGGNKSYLQLPAAGSFVLAVKIENTDDYMVVAASEIEKVQVMVGSESIAGIISDFITAIRNMKFTTNAGPTVALVNDMEFVNLQERINKILY